MRAPLWLRVTVPSLAVSILAALTFAFFSSPLPSQTPVDLRTKEYLKPELNVGKRNVRLASIGSSLANESSWDAFLSQRASGTEVYIDPRSGRASNIISSIPVIPGIGYGNDMTVADLEQSLGRSLESVDEEAVRDTVEDFIEANEAVLGVNPDQLGSVKVTRIRDHLLQFHAPQVVDGVPVRGAKVAGTIVHGNLVVIGTRMWEDVAISTTPTLNSAAAQSAAYTYLDGQEQEDRLWKAPELEIVVEEAPGRDLAYVEEGPIGGGYQHRLVWSFGFERAPDPARWEAVVDAHSGEMISFTDQLAHAKRHIRGGVYPATSTEQCSSSADPHKCGEMQSNYPMPWADTDLSSPEFTDGAGVLEGTGTVTSTLSGEYLFITEGGCTLPVDRSATTGNLDLGGLNGDHAVEWNGNDPCSYTCGGTGQCENGPHELVSCTSDAECYDLEASSASARTAFYELNRMHEAARGWLPTNLWANADEEIGECDQSSCSGGPYDGESCTSDEDCVAGRLHVKVNTVCVTPCDASYNLNIIHLCPQVTIQDERCAATGELSSFIIHEWGHGLDDFDANGTASDSREAYADIAQMYRQQASCMGYGLFIDERDRTCSTQTDDETGYNGNETRADGVSDHCLKDCSGPRDADWEQHVDEIPDTVQNHVCVRCDGQPHCIGAPVTQAAWDFAARDLQASPFNYDENTAFIIANRLFFLGSGNVDDWYTYDPDCEDEASDGCASTNGYMQWLAADDDNGNLLDGTPHMTALFAAFNRHHIACAPNETVAADYSTGPGSIVYPTDYTDTFNSENDRESLEETLQGGNSRLSHVWRFDDIPEGSHWLVFEGYRPSNAEGDNFQFAVSTNGSDYTEISGAIINKILEPAGGLAKHFGEDEHSGTFYIRVQDTVTTGSTLDTVHIDFLAIGQGAPMPQNSGCSGAPTAAPTLTVSHDVMGDRTLSWTAVTGASEYWVFKTEGHAGCDLGKVLIAETTSTSYVDSEVANNREYFYSVMAVGSNEACFTEASACPSRIGAESDYETDPGEVISPGSFEDTWASDDDHEILRETAVQGNSLLTHVWRFEQIPTGDHELIVEGWRTENSEDDNFIFAYSTDGTSYSQIANAVIDSESETSGGNAYSFGTSSISGTVYIKVEDTDPDGSHIDTLLIDYLAIRVTAGS